MTKGIVVDDLSARELSPVILRPRLAERTPFASLTALLCSAIKASQTRLVLIENYEHLRSHLGIFGRLATRVFNKHAAVSDKRYLADFRARQYPPALDPNTINLVGHINLADVLFVGDQINPIFKRFHHWPFHANKGCAVFMLKCLDLIGFDENRGMWTNINGPEDHIQSLLEVKPMRVIALGREALNGLQKRGVKVHGALPHPQYAKRFLSKTLNYAEELRKVLG